MKPTCPYCSGQGDIAMLNGTVIECGECNGTGSPVATPGVTIEERVAGLEGMLALANYNIGSLNEKLSRLIDLAEGREDYEV